MRIVKWENFVVNQGLHGHLAVFTRLFLHHKSAFMADNSIHITINLAHKLIVEQFPELSHLAITSVEKQGHDNRTYRLGTDMLIRMPTAESYALKVPKEQKLLPKLAPNLSLRIPSPLKMGNPSPDYPYHFSIYQWLVGKSINLLALNDEAKQSLACDLAKFLQELQSIKNVKGPMPGQHNWWRGDHVSVYDQGAREQIARLNNIINADKAIKLWEQAGKTRWHKHPVWIHGDLAIGNLLAENGKLSAVIDWGGMAMGDPACDLVMAWTYFNEKAREIFMEKTALDDDTRLRAKAWVLWKATFELCQVKDRDSAEAHLQKNIIDEVVD